MVTDIIGDYLTRIRNAQIRRKSEVRIPVSKILIEISRILKEEGFITDYKIKKIESGKDEIVVELKYDRRGDTFIRGIERVSKPGVRIYSGYRNISKVKAGQGITILTTSKGLLTGKKAVEEKIGGEVLCKIW